MYLLKQLLNIFNGFKINLNIFKYIRIVLVYIAMVDDILFFVFISSLLFYHIDSLMIAVLYLQIIILFVKMNYSNMNYVNSKLIEEKVCDKISLTLYFFNRRAIYYKRQVLWMTLIGKDYPIKIENIMSRVDLVILVLTVISVFNIFYFGLSILPIGV